MAGRTHIAAPGEPACGVDGCERPAGFATATPGAGPCLRHSGHAPKPEAALKLETPRLAADPEVTMRTREARRAVARSRLRGAGRPTSDVFALVRVLLLSAQRAGFPFEEAWRLALAAALTYMPDKKADDWWDVLWSTRQAWADAYLDPRSPLSVLPREVPAAVADAFSVRAPGSGRRRRRLVNAPPF